jgi:hypothetical protein
MKCFDIYLQFVNYDFIVDHIGLPFSYVLNVFYILLVLSKIDCRIPLVTVMQVSHIQHTHTHTHTHSLNALSHTHIHTHPNLLG